jgi:hypothetical protein
MPHIIRPVMLWNNYVKQENPGSDRHGIFLISPHSPKNQSPNA